MLDPGVVHDVGQRVERVPALASERRGHQCLVSFGHASSSRVADADVRFGRPVSNVSACRFTTSKTHEHVVLITIDRPEARNAADMEHFKALREAWERFAADDQAWVAIITGRGRGLLRGRRPQDVRARDHQAPEGDRREGPHRDRRLPPRRRHPRGAAQLAALQAGDRGGERLLHRRRHGDARRLRHPRRVPRGQVRGDGAEARALRRAAAPRCGCRARSRGRRRWSSCSAPT